MNKDTTHLLEELKNCSDFKKFYNENKEYSVNVTLSEYLGELLRKKDFKKSEVIKKAEMSEVYAYQIFSGIKKPDRSKLLCIIFGMGLNLEEAGQLLKCCGYPTLYVKNPADSIIIYAICNNYSVAQTNELLYEYGFDTLG